MAKLQIILIILSITCIFCNQGRLFDLNKMAEQGTLMKFLADAKMMTDGSPVSVEPCEDTGLFKITRMTVDPTEIVKGQSIRIKVLGVFLQDVTISKLHLDTLYNGGVIFTDNVDKGNTPQKKGTYAYDYEASVPTFVPSGKWEILINLLNDKEEKLSCVKATFEMP
jgi:hypothetical protein